jgi:tetratricopeptide (TPR) repeat protein
LKREVTHNAARLVPGLLLALLAPVASVWAAAPAAEGAKAAPEAEGSNPSVEAPESGEPPADAEPSVRARYWFDRGYEAAASKDHAKAGEAFDRSFEAIEAANTLFNAAYSYEQAGLRLESLERYRLYLERFKAQGDSAEVEAALVRIEAQLAELSVRMMGATEPVTIEVEGRVYARDDFPVWLEPGEVEVVVIDGREQRRAERLLLRPGQRRTLELTFVETMVPGPGLRPMDPELPPEISAEERKRRRQARQARWAKPVFWTTASVGLAGGLGWATFGPLVLRQKQVYLDAKCDPCGEGDSYPHAEEDRFGAYRTTANVMIGVAAVGAVTSLAFGLVWHRSAKAKARGESKGEDRARRQVRVRSSSSGFRLDF